jgi:hypothetical protein
VSRQKSHVETMPAIIRTAHGAAAAGGAIIVAEQPPLDEYPPLNADRTATSLALRAARGRPFRIGNAAAKGRGASLTRITVQPEASEDVRRVHQKAQSLANQRRRELEVQCGGPVTSAVRVELVAWARDTAWAEFYDRAGDALKASQLAEKASGHQLKATGLAEREGAVRRGSYNPHDQVRAYLAASGDPES